MYINEKVFSRFYIYISNHKNNVEVQREREREREREIIFTTIACFKGYFC